MIIEQQRISEQNKISEAWFLFPVQSSRGIIRFGCFFVLCCLSVGFFTSENVITLSKACLVFTLSLMMEFFPLFDRFPHEVLDTNNSKLLKKKKGTSIVFILSLTALFFFSFYFVVFVKTPPEKPSLVTTCWIYIVAYFLIFIYLLVNCIKGMSYIPAVTLQNTVKTQNMYAAAERGALGDAPEIKK